MRDRVAVCAAGEAAWHRAAYAGLGADWYVEDSLAWAPAVPHPFLLAAVTLGAGAYRALGFVEVAVPVHWDPPRTNPR